MADVKWIRFDEYQGPGVTKIWRVCARENGQPLGTIRWLARWRKYCFFPGPETVFEQDCLRDIAGFIEQQTNLHKQEKAKAS